MDGLNGGGAPRRADQGASGRGGAGTGRLVVGTRG